MKTQTKTYRIPSNSFSSWFTSRGEPLRPLALVLFWAVALAPAIATLLSLSFAGPAHLRPSIPAVWSVVGVCPVICGFWIAARQTEYRFAFALTGTVISLLLWAVNWIIMAEGCCATLR